jgi:hypothetical protein
LPASPVFAARVGEVFKNFVRVIDRRGHQFRRFVAGIPKHDALIASTFFLVGRLLGIHTLRNIRGLLMQQHINIGVGPVEAILLIANVFDGVAGDSLDHLDGNGVRAAEFACHNHTICRRHGLARRAQDPRIKLRSKALAIEQIDDFVGDAVADFVGVAFGNTFTSEKIRFACHRGPRRYAC